MEIDRTSSRRPTSSRWCWRGPAVLSLALAACWLSACGAGAAPGAATPAAVPEPVGLAQRALADELGRPPEAVTIRAVEAVDWPDGSLGCPQPDRMYPAVITPGFRVTLEVDGTSYTLHTDRTTRVVRCDG